MAEALLDTVAIVETPEGVVLRLAPAGLVPRALAQGVDVLIVLTLELILAAALSFAGAVGTSLLLIAAFVGQWLYPVLCEVLWNGQTVGKRTLGLRVVHEDGSPVRLPASLLRNLLLFVDLWFAQIFAFVCMLSTRRFQRVGDLVAGTMVVHVDADATRALALTLAAPLAMPPAAPAALAAMETVEPLPVPLRQDEQRLLVAFNERMPLLSAERGQELAELLAPLHGRRGAEAVRALGAMAIGIQGGA